MNIVAVIGNVNNFKINIEYFPLNKLKELSKFKEIFKRASMLFIENKDGYRIVKNRYGNKDFCKKIDVKRIIFEEILGRKMGQEKI